MSIIARFFHLVMQQVINNSLVEWTKRSQYSKVQVRNKQAMCNKRKGKAIINFSLKFGLPGFFYEYFHDIESWAVLNEENNFPNNGFKPIVRINHYGGIMLRESQQDDKDFDGNNTEYDLYAKKFFPRLEKPFPMPEEYAGYFGRTSERFWYEYGEDIRWIYIESIKLLTHFTHWENWIRARKQGATLDSPIDTKNPEIKWRHVLNFSVFPLGLTLEHDKKRQDHWHQRYFSKSLLNALQIMHLIDRSGTFTRVRACQWCDTIFTATDSDARWCSTYCGSTYRTLKSRKKPKTIQLAKEGISIEEIASKLNIDALWINEWLKEE